MTGVFTGIITAPFVMMGNLGKKMFSINSDLAEELTEDDVKIATAAVQVVASSDTLNYAKSWENPDTDAQGTVTLKEIEGAAGPSCKIINSEVRQQDKVIFNKDFTICSNDKDEWEIKE